MHKRFGALALAIASLPLVVLSAGTAVAQEGTPPAGRPCANGPGYTSIEGNPFLLSTSPKPSQGVGRRGETAVRVSRGAEVALAARLKRGPVTGPQKECPNERVGFYVRNAGSSQYVLIRGTDVVTDGRGLVAASKIASRDFRFFANYNTNATTIGARSSTTLVQTRP